MSEFSFKNKPSNWTNLGLFEKVKFTLNKFTPNFAPYVDKLSAKEIVKKICGDKIHIPKTIRVLKNFNDIAEKDLNSNHIIKGAHGSGYNINIKPGVKYDIETIKNKLQTFNQQYNPKYETQYSFLKPTFFIEEKIEDKFHGKDGDAICYLMRCIHGVPHTFTIRLKHKNIDQSYIFNSDKTLTEIKKPTQKFLDVNLIDKETINNMYDIAALLSKPFEFVRVDLYLGKDNKIYFSEYTFTPAGGLQRYPMDIELQLGKFWK